MRALGIDIGTTTIKGAVLDLASGDVGPLRVSPFPRALKGRLPTRHETAFPAIVEAVDRVLDRLCRDAPEAADLFLTGQMHGVGLFDAVSGMQPITPFISWKDERVLEPVPGQNDRFFDHCDGMLSEKERIALGNETRAGQGALTLAWLEKYQPPPDGAVPLPIGEALIACWSGLQSAVDATFAASLGVFDLLAGRWADSVIEKWGLSRFRWPEVAPGSVPANVVRRGRALRVYPALGDHQAALLGVGLKSEELSLNVSTGAQIAALSEDWKPGRYQTRPYPGGAFLNTLSHLPAGQMLRWLLDLLTEIPGSSNDPTDRVWDYIDAEASRVAETGLRVDLSFSECLTGSTGCIEGLTGGNMRVGQLFRAAFHSMAANFRRFAGQLDPGLPWERVAVSGSLIRRFQTLREEVERAFGLPLRLVEAERGEETLEGLYRWAARRLDG